MHSTTMVRHCRWLWLVYALRTPSSLIHLEASSSVQISMVLRLSCGRIDALKAATSVPMMGIHNGSMLGSSMNPWFHRDRSRFLLKASFGLMIDGDTARVTC